MSLFSELYNNPTPEEERRFTVIKARERLLGAVQIRKDKDGSTFARWHFTVQAWSHDWLRVDGLTNGQIVWELFNANTPADGWMWEDAKIVFPHRYPDLG